MGSFYGKGSRLVKRDGGLRSRSFWRGCRAADRIEHLAGFMAGRLLRDRFKLVFGARVSLVFRSLQSWAPCDAVRLRLSGLGSSSGPCAHALPWMAPGSALSFLTICVPSSAERSERRNRPEELASRTSSGRSSNQTRPDRVQPARPQPWPSRGELRRTKPFVGRWKRFLHAPECRFWPRRCACAPTTPP